MTLSGMIQQVLSGTGATLTIFFSTLVISLPLGLLVAFARMSDIRPFRRLESNGRGARLLKKFNPIRLIMQFFISVLRGTPLMLQLIVWCYGPYYLFRVSALRRNGELPQPFWDSASITPHISRRFSVPEFEGIPVGQREAAKVLGIQQGADLF